jgi:hypothetical protein
MTVHRNARELERGKKEEKSKATRHSELNGGSACPLRFATIQTSSNHTRLLRDNTGKSQRDFTKDRFKFTTA